MFEKALKLAFSIERLNYSELTRRTTQSCSRSSEPSLISATFQQET